MQYGSAAQEVKPRTGLRARLSPGRLNPFARAGRVARQHNDQNRDRRTASSRPRSVRRVHFLLPCPLMALRARELMHSEVVTVPAHASLLEVQHLLVVAQVSGVPVVNPGGEVVGIVSASDILRAMEQALDEDLDEGEPEDVLERLEAITAGAIATPEVIWVSPDASVASVAQVMRAEGIHRVLVGTREQLEGILTAYDLLRAL